MAGNHLKIVAWNIRAGGGRRIAGILHQLVEWEADIVGLSEFRGTPASLQLRGALADQGYIHQYSTINKKSPAKNALLFASKIPFKISSLKFAPKNKERWLMAKFTTNPPIRIGLMHIPNYTSPELKYPFMASILSMIDHSRCGPTIILGDSNCGKTAIDEEKTSGLFKREHEWINQIEARGWKDSYRLIHGARRVYSWYSHRNNGFRLDQAYCHPKLINSLRSCNYQWGINPQEPDRREGLSDHAALLLNLDLDQI